MVFTLPIFITQSGTNYFGLREELITLVQQFWFDGGKKDWVRDRIIKEYVEAFLKQVAKTVPTQYCLDTDFLNWQREFKHYVLNAAIDILHDKTDEFLVNFFEQFHKTVVGCVFPPLESTKAIF
jgi:hypothetical protein